MNYGRLVGAAVAATIADAVYGFLVYGMLLASEFTPDCGATVVSLIVAVKSLAFTPSTVTLLMVNGKPPVSERITFCAPL